MASNYRNLSIHYNSSFDYAPYTDALRNLFPPTGPGFFIDTNSLISANLSSTNSSTAQRTIVFASKGKSSYYITNCSISTIYVNLNINCASSPRSLNHPNCAATQIRQHPNPPLATNITAFDFHTVAEEIVYSWPQILSSSNPTTPTERFLADPATALADYSWSSPVELGYVSTDLFSKRLTLLINTFFQSTINPRLITNNTSPSQRPISLLTTTVQTTSTLPSRYILSMPWLTLYLISVALALLCGLLAIALRLRSQTPEILGYVSSLMRDSPYLDGPPGIGSTMGGIERSRWLWERRVRLCDVRGEKDVGRIAMAEVGAPLVPVVEVRSGSGRLYS
jgi:hypothetical protein